MRNSLDIVREARKLVDFGWHQGWMARLSDGTPTIPMDPGAVSFCLLGALYAGAGGQSTNYALGEAFNTVTMNLPWGEGLMSWNDRIGRTKEEVLAVLDKAILALQP